MDQLERLRLVGVSFTYSEADGTALRDASVAINRGERVGIVGPSGGGKATPIRLLLGLVPADSGTVFVNDVPIHKYDRNTWSERIGVVPQSAQVLNGTVAENLRLFRDVMSLITFLTQILITNRVETWFVLVVWDTE